MQAREIPESDRQRWNDFVASSPTGDLLQSWEWGELKRRSGGWQPIRLAVELSDKIVASVSILERRLPRLNKCIYYAPRGPVYDLADREPLAVLMQTVRERARLDGAILLKVDPPIPIEREGAETDLQDLGFVRVADKRGFGGVQPRCVMTLDLRPPIEEVLANCKPKWRYNIRLAEKKGVRVRLSDDRADLTAFYRLLEETAVRDGFLIRGAEYYEAIWDTLVEPGYARLFLAEYQGETLAGALSFIFGDKCWYTYGASSNSHRNLMPNHLLQWRMIEWAKSSGCSVYDFRGVSQKREGGEDDRLSGLNRFKAGFGAEFVEYIGEFDLPFSGFWYWAWSKGMPAVMSIARSLRGRRNEADGDASSVASEQE